MRAVLSILNTERGNSIAAEMIQRLSAAYDVVEYRHDGKKFEYPRDSSCC